MPKNFYRITIEALGLRDSKIRVINRLNEVLAHADDAELRSKVQRLIRELEATSTEPTIVPVKDMRSVKSAKLLHDYCVLKGYNE